jgi:uncharacterized cupredoxin-like copper-binding protein
MSSVRPSVITLGALVTVLLSLGSLIVAGLVLGGGTVGVDGNAGCVPPSLSGSVVRVSLHNMGRSAGHGMMGAGAMSLTADRSTVSSGKVSFLVSNIGSVAHELIVLPLRGSALAGSRAVGGDSRVDESSSLGEASASCTRGEGDGILPGASGWVTLTLRPGRYELLCNLAGHYEAGMYTQLTVT